MTLQRLSRMKFLKRMQSLRRRSRLIIVKTLRTINDCVNTSQLCCLTDATPVLEFTVSRQTKSLTSSFSLASFDHSHTQLTDALLEKQQHMQNVLPAAAINKVFNLSTQRAAFLLKGVSLRSDSDGSLHTKTRSDNIKRKHNPAVILYR